MGGYIILQYAILLHSLQLQSVLKARKVFLSRPRGCAPAPVVYPERISGALAGRFMRLAALIALPIGVSGLAAYVIVFGLKVI